MSHSLETLDAALLKKFKQGDLTYEEAETLLKKISRWICSQYPTLRSDAEELAQETIVRAVRSINTYRGASAFFSWLVSIAYRVCANHFHKLGDNPPVALETVADLKTEEDPEALAILEMVIDEALRALSDTEREVHRLRVFSRLSDDQIAQRLNLPSANAAQQAFKRASEKIGRYLSENGYLSPRSSCSRN